MLGVVGLDVLPVGPLPRAGRTGADLHAAVEVGGGVVPDDTEEGEGPYRAGRQAEDGAGGTVVGEGP
ncbi:hypothetical protein GCM10018789_28980 [Streptomyces werraensis]|nr:hypothetical protein GCM10018789_28980 [Streptomyces werraensis]